ncbi:UNVERIFIED_CONTAM: hypothetical protein FKN15_028730 [Acipenser sinensis]
MLAIDQGEAGLQVAQGQCAVDGEVDVSAALLGERTPVARVEQHKGGQGIKALTLQQVLHPGGRVARLHQHLADLEVQRLLVPVARQHVVPHAGEGVPDQEVSIANDQCL